MARIARVVAVGLPHHVTQRGNNRQAVFWSDTDRALYLKLLREHSQRHGLRLWGYCLMDNHVHLIAVPERCDSLSHTLRQAHSDYARYANVKRQSCGHFWQNRYYSCPLDAVHRWMALAYVETNPVRAGIVADACAYAWSSARAHTGGAAGSLEMRAWAAQYTPDRWREVLRSSIAEEALRQRIREATRTGRPCGDAEFTRRLESTLQRSLERKKPGRMRPVDSEQPALWAGENGD
jgi:putative transposase